MGPVPLAAAAFGASVLAVLLGAVNIGLLQLVPLRGAAEHGSGPSLAAPPEVLSLLAVGIHPVFAALATPAVVTKHLTTLRVVRLAAFVAVVPWTACLGLTLLRDISRLRSGACSRAASTAAAGCEGGGGAFRAGCVPSSRPCAIASAATALAGLSLLAAALSVWLVIRSASRAAVAAHRPTGGSEPPDAATRAARVTHPFTVAGFWGEGGPTEAMTPSQRGVARPWGNGDDAGDAEAGWGAPLEASSSRSLREDDGADADGEEVDDDDGDGDGDGDGDAGLSAPGHSAELRTLLPRTRG